MMEDSISIVFIASRILFLFLASGAAGSVRHCAVCSGHTCLGDPYNPDSFPGLIKCQHETLKYCLTEIRYSPRKGAKKSGKPLRPEDYVARSVTRGCTKSRLGNLCRRDWRGNNITCVSTCAQDFCNCDSRSPPRAMFKDRVLPLAPKHATYSSNDQLSCQARENPRTKLNRNRNRKDYENEYYEDDLEGDNAPRTRPNTAAIYRATRTLIICIFVGSFI